MRTYTEGDIRRFYSYVAIGKENECWEWLGSKLKDNYGQFCFQCRSTPAHRFAFWFSTGIDPEGLCVCHSCDNPSCVNPAHLWLGTQQDNVRDRVKKGRSIHGERQHSAKLTEAEVLTIRARYVAGGCSYPKLGKEYGVDQTLICAIIHRKVWTHI